MRLLAAFPKFSSQLIKISLNSHFNPSLQFVCFSSGSSQLYFLFAHFCTIEMSSQGSQVAQYKDAIKLLKKKCQVAESQALGMIIFLSG